jgi:hypothetical protein
MTDADRELPTGTHHEIPDFVGEAPETIPGAPQWANELITDVRAERRAMTKLVGRMELVANMLTDAVERLFHLGELERQVEENKREIASLKDWNKRLDTRVAELAGALNRRTLL